MLPNFPLCLEWLDFPPASSSSNSIHGPNQITGFGNYIAVGTLDPEIEIWSLDVLEAMYPSSILGRPDETQAHIPIPSGTGKKKKKKPKHRASQTAYHVDAVLGLSWNKSQRNLLASASADRTVKLWDLSRDPTLNGEGGDAGGAIRSFDVHKDKVQAVQWNEKEPTVLLTGSYDRTVRTFDSRAPTTGVGAIVGSDVEALRWDPWESYGFYVSTFLIPRANESERLVSLQVSLENGLVLNFDVRTLPSNLDKPSPAKFTLAAHDGPASSIDINPHLRGCIATGGTDKLVKVWNINDEENGKRSVSLVTSRDLGVVRCCYCFHNSCLIPLTGQGVLYRLVSGRPSDPSRRWLEGEAPNLGCLFELWCAQGLRCQAERGWQDPQRKDRRSWRCYRRNQRR